MVRGVEVQGQTKGEKISDPLALFVSGRLTAAYWDNRLGSPEVGAGC